MLDTLAPLEAEVQTRSGAWYLMRIRPYRTLENVIEGAVITFVDITGLKQAQEALNRARVLAESVVATVREPLVVLDGQIKVVTANPSFYRTFGGTPARDEGRGLFELGGGRWDSPELRRLLEEVLPRDAAFEDFELTQDLGPAGRRTIRLNARRVVVDDGEPELILLAFEDVAAVSRSGPGAPHDGAPPTGRE